MEDKKCEVRWGNLLPPRPPARVVENFPLIQNCGNWTMLIPSWGIINDGKTKSRIRGALEGILACKGAMHI